MNIGYGLAKGTYVAHMDADDIALSDRLERQVLYLERYRSVDILGTNMQCFGASQQILQVPAEDGVIKANLVAGVANVFNPTAMIRNSFLKSTQLACDSGLKGVFDWGFWVNAMCQGARFANIPETLLAYRVHEGQQSRTQNHLRAEQMRIRTRVLELFYPTLTLEERKSVEPLLQWISPPAISIDNLRYGLQVLDRLLMYRRQSKASESRETLTAFLTQCKKRWMAQIDYQFP